LPEHAAAGTALPLPAYWQAPATARRLEFLSDLHLAPDVPHTVTAFERYLQACDADALFILGDLFEVWVGDDVLAQPFEARCAEALRATARRLPVLVMRGNRDFLLGPGFFAATGCIDADDPLRVQAFGQAALLTHGDAWCLADTAYLPVRAQLRSAAWQSDFLARPLAQRQALAAQMRASSQAQQRDGATSTYTDVDQSLALQWLQHAGARTLIHGHTHRPQTEAWPDDHQRIVLPDWDQDHGEPRGGVLRWTADGFSLRPLD
jgi:UDP-2,3-diacylglucosamine hydrolase